jgi:hypothetical protein
MEFSVINNVERMKTEREWIERNLAEHPEKGEVGGDWDWMPGWLASTNQGHFNLKDVQISCTICGKVDVEMIHADFSLCMDKEVPLSLNKEYACGITFCRECAQKLGKL